MDSRAAQLWGAARTLSMHAAGGRCKQCRPDGSCELYREADEALMEWESTHGRPYTVQAPRWESVSNLRLPTETPAGGPSPNLGPPAGPTPRRR